MKSIEQIIKEGDAAIEAGIRYLRSQGKNIDLDNWVTVREYVKRFHLASENVVRDWVRRGIIPPGNVIFGPQNEIRLIKAEPYSDAATGQ